VTFAQVDIIKEVPRPRQTVASSRNIRCWGNQSSSWRQCGDSGQKTARILVRRVRKHSVCRSGLDDLTLHRPPSQTTNRYNPGTAASSAAAPHEPSKAKISGHGRRRGLRMPAHIL
jgi:hypothetical protein